jgi:SAM-dependent methyltransferase
VKRPASFDRLAPVYRALETVTFGGLLHWCRTAHLDRLGDRTQALVLGDGNGRFLADLLRAHPALRADSIDASAEMVRAQQVRVRAVPGAEERVRFAVADARTDPFPDSGYDLVVTNFFLDCFRPNELAQVVARAADACAPAALWVDGDFRLPASGLARTAARAALAGMYAIFRVATRLSANRLTDPAPLLTAAGFELQSEKARLRGFLSSRLWARKAPA